MSSSHQKARLAFISAVTLLLLSGVAATISIARLLGGEAWVVHTYQVQAELGAFDSAVAKSVRARQAYLTTAYEGFLGEFEVSVAAIPAILERLGSFTSDNPKQQDLVRRLKDTTERRVAVFQKSIELKRTDPQNQAGQAEITRQELALASNTTVIVQQMQDEEQSLLAERNRISNRRLAASVAILAVTFVFSIVMFFLHYGLLWREVKAREIAERASQESERMALQNQQASRVLSTRLLHVQDEERRKFSRELHDSLGQYLAGVKMHLDMLTPAQLADKNLISCIQLLDQSIAEVRTMSHLLHPPLLDEAGFEAAATWYVDGFSKRSGIAVSLLVPKRIGRLPGVVELSLFRVLQESLTNIHRHAKSTRAEIVLETSDQAVLRIRDNGTGFPPELLSKFKSNGTNVGVGLSGMSERVREAGGKLEIESSRQGTLIIVTIPLTGHLQSTGQSSSQTAS
jgi:signal transduction histidine kinase